MALERLIGLDPTGPWAPVAQVAGRPVSHVPEHEKRPRKIDVLRWPTRPRTEEDVQGTAILPVQPKP